MLQTLRTYHYYCMGRKTMQYILIAIGCLSLHACDIEDERDICCKRIVMEHRYTSEGQDAFEDNIHSLKHFLFDETERFVKEIAPGKNLQQQSLDELEAGSYTMVTLGNVTKTTLPDIPAKGEPLSQFLLQPAGTDAGNADPLYYGICRFDLVDKTARHNQRFVTYLANVHSKLQVTVKWQNLPPAMTTAPVYKMTLSHCADSYELDGKQGYSLGEKRFPYSASWNREHQLVCALKGLKLKEEFVSLRYTNSNLPVLHVLCQEGEGYKEITPALDLKTAFKVWGYKPENSERQEYKIIVTIYMDGHVGIKVEAETGVADWIEGGSFG
jgi:hypothetical protein